ncbi:MAG: hypothetical protein K5770_20435 [Lachnospiraceae bacterium]|nr:hypothetical protein [Lachnospiraceae bacterium]
MKKLQYFLVAIFMVVLAFLTAFISLYVIDPKFTDYVDKRIGNKSPQAAAAAVEESKETEVSKEPVAAVKPQIPAATEVPKAPEPEVKVKEKEEEPPVVRDDSDGVTGNVSDDYNAPSEKELEIPEGMADKTGYENIHVTEKTVSDEEADKIEKELSTGPLGEDLEFDPLYYPYYAMLDDRGKALYRQIYANMNEMNPAFRSVDKMLTGKRIDSAFEAVFNDHPELFWIDTEYRTIYRKNGDFIELDLFYNDTEKRISSARMEFETAAEQIASAAQGNDYEKERFVHNALAELFEYQRNPLDQSAYSGLVDNKTVCAGYARSFAYIMTKMGIPCYLCTGYAGEAHGWNIIKLEDDYYNVDVTWDDTGTDNPYYNYEWFNKTDNDYGLTHIRKGLSVHLPACRGKKYRNLESEEPEEENLATLQDYGFTENDVISDLGVYYDTFYRKLFEVGKGTHTINMVISEGIVEDFNRAYTSSEIKEKVLYKLLSDIGAGGANLSCSTEKLEGGYYLVKHDITIS